MDLYLLTLKQRCLYCSFSKGIMDSSNQPTPSPRNQCCRTKKFQFPKSSETIRKTYRVVKGGSKGRGFPNLPKGSPIFPRNP